MMLPSFWFKLVVFSGFVLLRQSYAQQNDCVLKEPVVHIHFGQGNVKDINATSPESYERVSGACPTDGHYTFSSSTPGCFYGDWFSVEEDHTPGDNNGNMMIVNAYPGGGVFLQTQLSGLRGNATYELALWLLNVCNIERCCSSLSPNIYVRLSTVKGVKIIGFSIGELMQTSTPVWRKYKGMFTMPAGETKLLLTMQDNAIGGCGNDFALDDITLRECVKAVPVVNEKARPPAASHKQTIVKKKKAEAPLQPPKPQKQIAIAPVKKDSTGQTPLPVKSLKAQSPVPSVLRTRANPLIRKFDAPAGEIRIDLYDNGEIDGDTVSIYHNNQLLVSRARLSQKPISFNITVNEAEPHHELIMVAENLGSIPPNTSLMILTAKNKKYQVFISSTEQKNAKLVIDLKD